MRLSATDYMLQDNPLHPLIKELATALMDAGIATSDQAAEFLASLTAQSQRDDDLHVALRTEADTERQLIERSFPGSSPE